MSEIKTASVLSFERKLDPSDALFFSGNWEERNNATTWPAVVIREKAVRGTISNRLKTKDQNSAKLDAEVEKANLQRVDVAALLSNHDTLNVRFTLRVLGEIGTPSTCNNLEYRKKLIEVIQGYAAEHQFSELAKRYAYNIANGRFLWRNRTGAENIEIRVQQQITDGSNKEWSFNSLEFSLRNFEVNSAAKAQLENLAEVIKLGLLGEVHALLNIQAFVKQGNGQEVFPSQELILDDKSSKKGQKSKTLYQVNDIAAMHSQKIGNALRSIDNWYQDDIGMGPIAIEPYGSVTSLGKAYRQPKQGMDFYSLFDNWIIKNKVPDVNSQHFIVANLIRGGVFGDSGKE